MKRWRHATWLVAIGLLAAAVVRSGSDASSDPQVVAAAREALGPFKQQLMAALQEGLAQGPEAAIDACRVRAPQIASSLATDTIQMGRTSHRLRNPQNAPRLWMEPLLEEFRRAGPGEIEYRVAPAGPGRLGYVEPIYVQPLCLTCHGTALEPALRDRIRAAYPEDRATGFALGDFRGLFWVELDATREGT